MHLLEVQHSPNKCINVFTSFVCLGCGQDNNNLQSDDTLLANTPKLQLPFTDNGNTLNSIFKS